MTAKPNRGDPYRLTGRAMLGAAAAALVIAAAAVTFVLRYYHFYHFGVGPSFAVLMLGFPAAVAAVFASMVGALAICQRRRASRRRALSAAVAVGLGIAVAACAYEVWRTTADRSGEGPGAGDLAPFFASLVGAR